LSRARLRIALPSGDKVTRLKGASRAG
jgi:hypothetical protein